MAVEVLLSAIAARDLNARRGGETVRQHVREEGVPLARIGDPCHIGDLGRGGIGHQHPAFDGEGRLTRPGLDHVEGFEAEEVCRERELVLPPERRIISGPRQLDPLDGEVPRVGSQERIPDLLVVDSERPSCRSPVVQ
jgi:hypothetical protein